MPPLQFKEYEYSPLPTPTSIRLLRLHRTRDGILPSLCGYPVIQCSLHVVDLASDEVPPYEALSYTWDNPQPEWRKRKTDTWKDDCTYSEDSLSPSRGWLDPASGND